MSKYRTIAKAGHRIRKGLKALRIPVAATLMLALLGLAAANAMAPATVRNAGRPTELTPAKASTQPNGLGAATGNTVTGIVNGTTSDIRAVSPGTAADSSADATAEYVPQAKVESPWVDPASDNGGDTTPTAPSDPATEPVTPTPQPEPVTPPATETPPAGNGLTNVVDFVTAGLGGLVGL